MAENTTAHKDRMKEITDSIEQGIKDLFQSDKYMEYLRSMSRFHRYSLNNTLLIAMQRPDATLVAGFNKWRDQFERNVMRGEKGIKIIAPTPFKKRIEQEKLDPQTKAPMLDKDGKVVTEEVEIKIPMYKVVSVFDVSQTEGKPLPQLASNLTGDVKQYEIFMEALRRSSPVPISIEAMTAKMDGYFDLEHQDIAIRRGMSEVQTVSAVIHEIAHAKLHNREQAQLAAAQGDESTPPPKPKDRRTEEVEAESISYAVCTYYGIATGENSFGYIATWSKDKELPELRTSLETINKTASGLIDDIDRHFAEIAKERGIDLTEKKEMDATASNLAVAIDEFSYDYDPYEYRNAIDDREQAVAELTADIEQGNIQHIKDWLLPIIEEQDENSAKAQHLMDQLDSLSQGVQMQETGQPAQTVLPEQSAPPPPETLEPDILYQTHTNPRSVGEHDRSFIQAYTRADGALIPGEVIGVGTSELCIGLTNRLNSKDIQPEQAKTALAEPPAADGYPMPDPTLTIADRNAYGYTEDDMLPVSKDKAIELYEKDFTVYMLYDDNSEGMAFDRDDIDGHIGLFGVNREEWEESQEYLSLIEGHEVTQQELENNFLNNPADAFAIYQLKRTEETRDLRFEPLERLQAVGLTVERDNYDLIYTDRLADTGSTSEKLNALWEQFNIDHPADYRGQSLSVSDIVALRQNGAVSCHYVDSFGFKELPAFLRPENYLKNAEMAMEDDYGMIDGIINNGKNPSVAELEAQVKAGGQISLSDLARAVHAERMEKRPSVLEQLKTPPMKQERHKTAPSRGAEMER
jgi:antirestriction protein ArdC